MEAILLDYVPIRFDLYRTVPRHLHWTLQNLIGFADTEGRCFPSVRLLSNVTGTPRSTVAYHLAQLAQLGIVARQRRPGGVYAYTIAARFLPGLSNRPAKPIQPARTEENPVKKTGSRFGFTAAIDNGLPRAVEWEPRLRAWGKSRFWLPQWGPKPSEAGCWAPLGGAA
jgi:DNA-binding transcriptional ArsR family regulator